MRFLAILPLLALGCGGGDELSTHEGVTAAHIRAMEELGAVLDGVYDRQTAEAATSRMAEIAKRVRELREAEEKLPEASPTERARLDARLEDAAKALELRLEQAMARVGGDSEAVVLLANLMIDTVLDLDR